MASPAQDLSAFLPLLFPVLWLGMGVLFSWVSGWATLARRFPGHERPEGLVLRSGVSGIGALAEHNVTGLVVAQEGLYLWSNILFRFWRPPIFLPWAHVHDGGMDGLLWKSPVLLLDNVTDLSVGSRALEAIRPHLAPRPALVTPDVDGTASRKARVLMRANGVFCLFCLWLALSAVKHSVPGAGIRHYWSVKLRQACTIDPDIHDVSGFLGGAIWPLLLWFIIDRRIKFRLRVGLIKSG